MQLRNYKFCFINQIVLHFTQSRLKKASAFILFPALLLFLVLICSWKATGQVLKVTEPAKAVILTELKAPNSVAQKTAIYLNDKLTNSPGGGCQIHRRGDFNGDGKTDYSLFRPSNGTWYIQPSGTGTPYGVQFGVGGFLRDYLQPADYDGDGKTDIGVFRRTTGIWYLITSSDNTIHSYQFGATTQTSEPIDVPVAGDYTGDGKADIAVYRRETGVWYVFDKDNKSMTAVQWGGDPTDTPVLGDFDGDCKMDFALRRSNRSVPESAQFYIRFSSGGTTSLQWGIITKTSIAIGDYNGDGRSDIGAVITKNSLRFWYVIDVKGNVLINGEQFGKVNDIAAQGDYDGDSKTDLAVYRLLDSIFFYKSSIDNSQNGFAFGTSGDVSPLEYAVGLPLN